MLEPQTSALRTGLLAAGAVVGYFLLFYFIDKKLFLNPAVSWASMGIYLAFMWRAAAGERARFGASAEFKALLRAAFLVFLLANLAYWLLFYGVALADSDLTDFLKNLRRDEIRAALEKGTGDPALGASMQKELAEIEKNGFRIGLGDVLLRMSMGAIGGFLLSAGVGFLVARRED